MTITAKFASKCCNCGMQIDPGTKIEWNRGERARHTECPRVSGFEAEVMSRTATVNPMPVKKHVGNICDNTGDNIYECECHEHRNNR